MSEERILFYKIYEDRESMNGNFYVERADKITEQYLRDAFEDCFIGDSSYPMPVFEPILMTQDEYEKLPDFTGY